MLDEMKEVSFYYATKAGVSRSASTTWWSRVEKPRMILDEREQRGRSRSRSSAPPGVITAGERHNKIIDIWHRVTESVSEEMFRDHGATSNQIRGNEFNPIRMMADSGARGNASSRSASWQVSADSWPSLQRRHYREADHRRTSARV